MSVIKKHWPLIAAIVILLGVVSISLVLSIKQNQGHLVYALDDPYIHMAMAKNFAQYGVWGVTKYGFTSSSSSLLWTLFLSAAYFLFGINEVCPLLLNVVFGLSILILVNAVLRQYIVNPLLVFGALLSIVLFTPLVSLIFCGQEHTLHLLITLPFVYLSSRVISSEKPSYRDSSSLLMLAPLVTMARYEGLFLIVVVVSLLLTRRRPAYAIALVALGILPIPIYGLFSVLKGWCFVPNSVLLKGNMLDFSSLGKIARFFGGRGFYRLTNNPDMLTLTLVALFILYVHYSKENKVWTEHMTMLIIFIPTVLLHVHFALVGQLYRYEGYLVGFGIVAVIVALSEYLPTAWHNCKGKRSLLVHFLLSSLIFLALSPLILRGILSLIRTPQATTNIYQQQYQMGLFLREFYQSKKVAANDIGAINFLADIRCFDLWGLANPKIAEARMKRDYNSQWIFREARTEQVRIAIVYDHWFETEGIGGIPSQWTKVGEWKISNNVVCGGDTVSFYAVDSSEIDNLIRNLRAFSSYLPKDVVQTGRYTK